jgi:lipopolysaccharide/colanic/teichoic acid biosynthesis glycosyltransferase
MRRAFDTVCAAAGLILLAPVFAVIALAIRLKGGPGPVFYLQPRVGKDGREFHLIKFRSMVTGTDRHAALTVAEDPRVTRVGHFLRRYKLDELPQLINVVKGDMRLVGPRPEMKRYVDSFPIEYKVLLKEPPGITDPASLAFRDESKMLNEGNLEAHYLSEILPQKLRLSMEYSRRRTFLSDLKIIFQTVAGMRPEEYQPSLPGYNR